MDLRIKKTKSSIINAFLELRSKKELEKITVKELCETAQINKSTFYTHYQDIYDLSEQLEDELVTSRMNEIRHPENVIENPAAFTRELFEGCLAKGPLIDTLFSGNRSGLLIERIETALKKSIYELYPQFKNDMAKDEGGVGDGEDQRPGDGAGKKCDKRPGYLKNEERRGDDGCQGVGPWRGGEPDGPVEKPVKAARAHAP